MKDGLVRVEKFGNVLIKKENLDKFIDTMVGVPVIINHKNLTADNADDERVGVVNSVWYDTTDGWFWCDGVIWDKTAQNLITDKNWSVSCSYDVKLANDEGGSENNIKYDIEFLDAVFTHLALVNNPRYERANIVFNSKTVIENYRADQKRDKYGRFMCEGKSSFFNSWNDAPTFELEKNELHQYIDNIEELRTQAEKYYQYKLQGKPILRPELGEIRVSGKGADEYFHFSADIDKLLAVPQTPELIKNGKLGEFEPEHKDRNDSIVGYYPIYANLKTDNGNRKAELLIAKDKDGRLFYQMFLDFDRQKAQERALKKEATAGTNPPASNNNIPHFNKKITLNNETVTNINNEDNNMEIIEKLKALIFSVENEKEQTMVENEKVDKRKLIDEVAGIMKSAGCDDEDIRTAIGKMEKIGYDKSEADTADNKKEEKVDNKCKVKNEDEEDKKEVEEVKEDIKEDVDNKCKKSKVDNSKTDYFSRMQEIYNSASSQVKDESAYVSRADREKAAEEYFAR